MPVSLHGHARSAAPSGPDRGHVIATRPRSVNLIAFAREVHDDLAQAACVADHAARQVAVPADHLARGCFSPARCQQSIDLLTASVIQRRVSIVSLWPPDLGEVGDVVEIAIAPSPSGAR